MMTKLRIKTNLGLSRPISRPEGKAKRSSRISKITKRETRKKQELRPF